MPGGRKPALVWFRNDLRLHDHEPLAAACAAATSVLPVYIFDPREYGKVGLAAAQSRH
jgi:deoxyribodipyrimidine photolyase